MAAEFADRPARFIAEMVAGEFVSVASTHAVNEAADTIEAYAKARESRVRAAVIADLRGLLESAHTVEGSPVYNAEYVYADSIRNLIETLEAQQS